MKNFKMRVNGLPIRATSATKVFVEAWFFDQKKIKQACATLDRWANEFSSKFCDSILRYYGEADSLLVGWAENGDLLLVAMTEKGCEAFCATVPLRLLPPACDFCQMQAAMDRVNVLQVGLA